VLLFAIAAAVSLLLTFASVGLRAAAASAGLGPEDGSPSRPGRRRCSA